MQGTNYSHETVQQALALLELKKKYPNNVNLSYSNIARLVEVHSHETISNWEKLPMDDISVMTRRMNKGHNRKLSLQEELVVSGWILHQNETHSPTTTNEVKIFIEKFFFIRVSDSWITRFNTRQHFSHLLPSKILYRENMDAREVIEKWIKHIREVLKDKSPDQVSIISYYTDLLIIR